MYKVMNPYQQVKISSLVGMYWKDAYISVAEAHPWYANDRED